MLLRSGAGCGSDAGNPAQDRRDRKLALDMRRLLWGRNLLNGMVLWLLHRLRRRGRRVLLHRLRPDGDRRVGIRIDRRGRGRTRGGGGNAADGVIVRQLLLVIRGGRRGNGIRHPRGGRVRDGGRRNPPRLHHESPLFLDVAAAAVAAGGVPFRRIVRVVRGDATGGGRRRPAGILLLARLLPRDRFGRGRKTRHRVRRGGRGGLGRSSRDGDGRFRCIVRRRRICRAAAAAATTATTRLHEEPPLLLRAGLLYVGLLLGRRLGRLGRRRRRCDDDGGRNPLLVPPVHRRGRSRFRRLPGGRRDAGGGVGLRGFFDVILPARRRGRGNGGLLHHEPSLLDGRDGLRHCIRVVSVVFRRGGLIVARRRRRRRRRRGRRRLQRRKWFRPLVRGPSLHDAEPPFLDGHGRVPLCRGIGIRVQNRRLRHSHGRLRELLLELLLVLHRLMMHQPRGVLLGEAVRRRRIDPDLPLIGRLVVKQRLLRDRLRVLETLRVLQRGQFGRTIGRCVLMIRGLLRIVLMTDDDNDGLGVLLLLLLHRTLRVRLSGHRMVGMRTDLLLLRRKLILIVPLLHVVICH